MILYQFWKWKDMPIIALNKLQIRVKYNIPNYNCNKTAKVSMIPFIILIKICRYFKNQQALTGYSHCFSRFKRAPDYPLLVRIFILKQPTTIYSNLYFFMPRCNSKFYWRLPFKLAYCHSFEQIFCPCLLKRLII